MCPIFYSAPTIKDTIALALSDTEIEISWTIDSSKSGYLRPFSLRCVGENVTENGSQQVDSRLTSIRVTKLNPNTLYHCTLTVSAYPARGQNLDECTTSANVEPIWTNLHCTSGVFMPNFPLFFIVLIIS